MTRECCIAVYAENEKINPVSSEGIPNIDCIRFNCDCHTEISKYNHIGTIGR